MKSRQPIINSNRRKLYIFKIKSLMLSLFFIAETKLNVDLLRMSSFMIVVIFSFKQKYELLSIVSRRDAGSYEDRKDIKFGWKFHIFYIPIWIITLLFYSFRWKNDTYHEIVNDAIAIRLVQVNKKRIQKLIRSINF